MLAELQECWPTDVLSLVKGSKIILGKKFPAWKDKISRTVVRSDITRKKLLAQSVSQLLNLISSIGPLAQIDSCAYVSCFMLPKLSVVQVAQEAWDRLRNMITSITSHNLQPCLKVPTMQGAPWRHRWVSGGLSKQDCFLKKVRECWGLPNLAWLTGASRGAVVYLFRFAMEGCI